ncbi:hypothetical protein ACODM8_05760 [Vibrio ostreicida]|uniref:hypothetical protein n=1 Tax=Vibrio ostreicida TaxID=526588 RepID=UPI003B5C5E7E
MRSLIELMGQETYDLIYTHYDASGNKIEDPEDVFYCDESDIDESRIEGLKRLLVPTSSAEETLVPMEASKLLAAWGDDAAVEYYQYCITSRIDLLGNLEPHRLHSYDTTYEEITSSLFHFWARYADRSKADEGFKKIKPLISNILVLAQELPYNMSYIIPTVKRENWHCFDEQLKHCFICTLRKKVRSRNDYWNLIDLKLLFQEWAPDFLSEIESKYGFIDIPEDMNSK